VIIDGTRATDFAHTLLHLLIGGRNLWVLHVMLTQILNMSLTHIQVLSKVLARLFGVAG
jgi:hypothetical protein